MRGLSQESYKLPLIGVNITRCAEATKRSGSNDESIIGVESSAGTTPIIVMFKQLVEKREAEEVANTPTSWVGRCG